MGSAAAYISGIHKVQSQIPILLQQVPDHRLLLGGEEVRLLDVLEPGTFIRLVPGRFSLADLLGAEKVPA